MFNPQKHAELITLGTTLSYGNTLDLSPENKRKLAGWKKEFGRDPKTDFIKFVPNRKQFYSGGIRGILWPGYSEFSVTGFNRETPSDMYEIPKEGYCPRDEKECIRLLLLSQHPENRICLYENRELDAEAKTSELKNQELIEENRKQHDEIEELRMQVAQLSTNTKPPKP